MKPLLGTVLCSLLGAAGLSAQVAAPSPGVVRYPDLPLQALLGIPGNLLPAATSLGNAETVSFSDSAGLLVRANVIRLVRLDGSLIGEYPYAGALPVLGADPSPSSALAWLPETHELLWWNGKGFQKVTIDGFEGHVSSVRHDTARTAQFLVNHPDRTVSSARVSLPQGDSISVDYLPGVKGPAYQFGSCRISVNQHRLLVEWSGGAQQTMSFLADTFSSEEMSSAWIHLYVPATGQHWGLHLNQESSTLSRLPAPFAGTRGQQ